MRPFKTRTNSPWTGNLANIAEKTSHKKFLVINRETKLLIGTIWKVLQPFDPFPGGQAEKENKDWFVPTLPAKKVPAFSQNRHRGNNKHKI